MDNNIATFLAFTATEDPAVAKQFLELSGDNVEYAVQLFIESDSNSNAATDEALAQRLQLKAYQDTNVREADTTVHRHETLEDSFGAFGGLGALYRNQMATLNAMFGRGRTGVFNQRVEELEDSGDDMYDDEDNDDDEIDYGDEQPEADDYDDVEEVDSTGNSLPRRARSREEQLSGLSLTQRRLADLFKPPFDIMSRVSLDEAKVLARGEEKWILVNIQDNSEFQCQVLNRDFWLNSGVKSAVRRNFKFLQYQVDSTWGEMFCNFYHVDSYPYICILDPMTCERVRQWPSGKVPDTVDWLTDVELFLEKFLLGSGAQNPIVEHEVRFDPDSMSEEQQIEYALRQSIANDPSQGLQKTPEPDVPADPFDSIITQDHIEPSSGTVTRIQVRFSTGKRLVHKFDFENDKVVRIYEWLKHVFSQNEESIYGIGPDDRFQISTAGADSLIKSLQKSVGEAGLKNASVLVEKC
ncbi:hypothetical protein METBISCDRAFT_17674 [Metschnikowia bicuspidata]|uniref:UBX domain-containing protein n=1 Tax=Metschnikowia bicuspidata TaxID=27322 RepID=A0A4V1J2V1_9ASCO|nr:hypothetical protein METBISCDRAFT_17674 [Metschnikowia bicuspidata]